MMVYTGYMVQSPVVGESYILELKRILEAAKSDTQLYEAIVNAPFHSKRVTTTLGLGFLSFVLINKKTRTIDRIAISKTDLAQGALDITVKPFRDLKVPIGYKGNAVAEAIRSGRYQQTNDWDYLLTPSLKPEEARLNQAAAGIASSYVYPLINTRNSGAIIYQYFITLDKIESTHREFMFRYTKLASQVMNRQV
jgi:hypothetical protein